MKLARVFCSLIILGISSTAAYAQTPVDPRVLINDPVGCTIPPGISFPGPSTATLVESFLSPECFTYQPPGVSPPNLDQLFFEFTDVPPLTEFICQTDIWVFCGTVSSPPGTIEFHLHGAGPCQSNDGLFGTCPGFMAPGASATVTLQPIISEIPEPGSIILFGTGLISIFMAAKRRFDAQT